MRDHGWLLVDRVQHLTEAIHMLVAAELAGRHYLSADQAALQAAQLRHDVRHAFASWRPPRDGHGTEDLPR